MYICNRIFDFEFIHVEGAILQQITKKSSLPLSISTEEEDAEVLATLSEALEDITRNLIFQVAKLRP